MVLGVKEEELFGCVFALGGHTVALAGGRESDHIAFDCQNDWVDVRIFLLHHKRKNQLDSFFWLACVKTASIEFSARRRALGRGRGDGGGRASSCGWYMVEGGRSVLRRVLRG